MAEFKDIIKQKERMCRESNCCDCPIDGYFDSCVNITAKNAEKYEELVMQWAKENPEDKYPTWKEWQKENFPEAECEISVCQFMKCDNDWKCESCRNRSIPSDIAKRLGIKPKGEKNV